MTPIRLSDGNKISVMPLVGTDRLYLMVEGNAFSMTLEIAIDEALVVATALVDPYGIRSMKCDCCDSSATHKDGSYKYCDKCKPVTP